MINVVIPMYNSEDTIACSLDSVLKQTYRGNIKLLIINDGSTDNSEYVVNKYIFKELPKNIKIELINKKNGGVSSARNRGIMESQGEWIALLDSDDIWLPEKLEKQMNEIKKNPNIKFIGTNRNNESYPFFGKEKLRTFTLTAKELLFKWHPHNSTALIKSSLLKGNLFDETRSHAEDGDMLLKWVCKHSLYVLNESLVLTGGDKRSFGESGLSADIKKMHRGEMLALKGALKRKQINCFEYLFFYAYLSLKYLRRIFIVRLAK